MIKSLTIELALRNFPQKKLGPSRGTLWPGNLNKYPQPEHIQYNVVTLQRDISMLPELDFHIEPGMFFSKIKGENKRLLNAVSHVIKTYIETENKDITSGKYDISGSFAYFAFLGEHDTVIFSSPHITSPVMFNPNDPDSSYELIPCPTFLPVAITSSWELLKRVNTDIISYESLNWSTLITSKRQPDEVYTTKNVINSLLDYYENRATKSSLSVELKSIYEDRNEHVVFPEIATISTYELKRFHSFEFDSNY